MMNTLRKKIIILGATGSIGSSCVDIVRRNPEAFEIVGLSAHTDRNGLLALASEFGVKKTALSGANGEESILAMIAETEADIAVNGIAGASGLLPSKVALETGKDLALANKETIVMAGPLIRELAGKLGRKILPVDSEHSAVFNLMNEFGADSVEEIILTASGGPFRTWDSERIAKATREDALKHPTWSMGSKITIDSASMANKGLEVIEAVRLFDMPPDRVKVVVHPQSLVHSFIRTKDGVLYAQISNPDMRHPILSALSWPEYRPNHLEKLSFEKLCTMQFEPPRYQDFPLLGLAYRAAGLGGSFTIAFNAANEEAVAAFLAGTISFPALAEVTAKVMENDWAKEPSTFEEIIANDKKARELARSILSGISS
jgi:1-deoxy-D-xylulose-5-phosphate reductoisomerase